MLTVSLYTACKLARKLGWLTPVMKLMETFLLMNQAKLMKVGVLIKQANYAYRKAPVAKLIKVFSCIIHVDLTVIIALGDKIP